MKNIICHWRFAPTVANAEQTKTRLWHREDSYLVDEKGDPLLRDQDNWRKWMWEHGTPIMSRAATLWTPAGVELLCFHPPQFSAWFSYEFYKDLCKLPNWSRFLESGYDLHLGTIAAAEKLQA